MSIPMQSNSDGQSPSDSESDSARDELGPIREPLEDLFRGGALNWDIQQGGENHSSPP